jgi:hypothetical protein
MVIQLLATADLVAACLWKMILKSKMNTTIETSTPRTIRRMINLVMLKIEASSKKVNIKILTTPSRLMLAKLVDITSHLKTTLKYKKIMGRGCKAVTKESKTNLQFGKKNQQIQLLTVIDKQKWIVKIKKGHLIPHIRNTTPKRQCH